MKDADMAATQGHYIPSHFGTYRNILSLLLCVTVIKGQLPPVFPTNFTIGAALSSTRLCDIFEERLNATNNKHGLLPLGVTLKSRCIQMSPNPIVAAEVVCDTLIPGRVYITIASHSGDGELSPMSVSFTCGFYNIPVIGISSRDSSFSDENVHTAFMRTVAPYSEQTVIWVEMLRKLQFRQVLLIHTSDQEGHAILSKFQSILDSGKDVEIQLEKSFKYTAGMANFTDLLSLVQSCRSRVVLLYASEADAEKIYSDAERLDVIGKDYTWIVTEQALGPVNTPIGVLGLKLDHSTDEVAHLQDSIDIIAKAIKQIADEGINITAPHDSCDLPDPTSDVDWEPGTILLETLKSQELDSGATGVVQFNDVGDRILSNYEVFNKRSSGLVPVGTYGPEQDLVMHPNVIVWPGGQRVKPKGIKISTHLKVVTILALPFVNVTLPKNGECEEYEIPCPRYNESQDADEDFCCYGYCIDLLKHLGEEVNFTYELHLSTDGMFGSYEYRNNTSKKWNGMIGELTNGNGDADMIMAPLTIDPTRAVSIDFTKPFKYQGMTILVKKTIKNSNLASFLQPFQDTLWILVGLSVHVVALVLYLLDRFSPFGRFKLAKSDDTEEDALNLSGAVWFAWGVLLNSGIGEGTPRSFSARVLGMVWAGFAMIIVASYTANLAAFLVLDRPEASISGIDDARLRNPQDNFKYATVRDSAVAMYFKRQVELSTMYRTMEQRFYEDVREAIEAVKAGELHAFIWDSSRLEYEAANDCDLVTAGELFGRSGYGIGLPEDSPWTDEISLKILSFHETGYMEMLDNKWIMVSDKSCPGRDASPATLGLTNMAGVFMMVAGGIVAGVILIFIEITYKRHRGLKEKELELAKTAADRWRGNIEKRRTLRRTLLQQQQERSKAKNGTTDSPAHTLLTQYTPSSVPAGYQPVATNIKSSPLPV